MTRVVTPHLVVPADPPQAGESPHLQPGHVRMLGRAQGWPPFVPGRTYAPGVPVPPAAQPPAPGGA